MALVKPFNDFVTSGELGNLFLLHLNPGPFALSALVSPGHARGVMCDTEPSALVEKNHAAVAFQPSFQMKDGFLGHGIRRPFGLYTVSGPLGQDQFHDGLAPTCTGDGGAQVIGITATADQ